jgi:hypothetical protein
LARVLLPLVDTEPKTRNPSPLSIGVSTKPGGILFTVMPVGASSCANAFVKAITPPFDAA